MKIIDWINQYQGFFMSLLTLIYVGATIKIWSSNKKSADAAAAANKQQYALSLLDKRLEVYYCLNDWLSIANSLSFKNFPSGNSLDAFNALLYANAKDETFLSLNKRLAEVEIKLQNNAQSLSEKQELLLIRDQLAQERFFKRIAMLDVEAGKINQIELLFPAVNFKIIKQFSDAFTETAICTSAENIERLKTATEKVNDNKTLELLWCILKAI